MSPLVRAVQAPHFPEHLNPELSADTRANGLRIALQRDDYLLTCVRDLQERVNRLEESRYTESR
jgi:hypothetical protein